jgi:hypothetical protein
MNEPRPGYSDGIREMGKRAAANGAPITSIDDNDLMDRRDRELWLQGWRQFYESHQTTKRYI